MLVFSTRLPLKDEAKREDCLSLFIDWVKDSAYYNAQDLEYDVCSQDEYSYLNDKISFHIKNYKDSDVDITACRLENRDGDALWENDCIFLAENGKKSIFIQLNCNTTSYEKELPEINKPRIVWLFVESGLCDTDNGIPITDKPLLADEYYDKCVEIINGEYDMMLPAVYISRDYCEKSPLKPAIIAGRLGGVAHVFYEKKSKTSRKIRSEATGNSAYGGYIGVYYPGTAAAQKFSLKYHNNNSNALLDEIVETVLETLANRREIEQFDWIKIASLQSRQKMSELSESNKQYKDELDEYVLTFDQEMRQEREKRDLLIKQNQSLRAQLDALRAVRDDSEGGFYNPGSEKEFYPGEKSDFLNSVLKQVKEKLPEGSRAKHIAVSLFEANPKNGEGERIIREIKRILENGDALGSKSKAELRDLGFKIDEEGKHIKLLFHDDERYMFPVSKTPSDNKRGGKNLAGDICKTIEIDKKI